MNEITIKKTQGILAASLRTVIYDFNDMGPMWEELNAYIDKQRVRKTVPCMTLYHNGFDPSKGMDVEVIEPIAKAFPDGSKVKVYELPAEDKMACVVHNGSFQTIPSAYGAINEWISKNGYEIKGAAREIYHKGDWATNNPEEYVTEIQYPLK